MSAAPKKAHDQVLELSKDLELPANAVTQTFAFLARRGAGKTYAAGKLCEEMLLAGAQVVVVEPVGVWWGLRLAADGKGPGLTIPVFGGLHGDIPLEPGAGALVADLVVDRGVSVVLDVSMFRKGDRKRFVTDFAEQLFHRKKEKRSPLHLFVEEAQVFAPQRVQADEARMLGAFEDLVKLGRNFGIGVTLISQRPQAINKDCLNQTEALFVLQTNGAQERKALKEWVVDQGLKVDLLEELPGLPIGTAYCWSPQWLRVLKKVRIGTKRTFNASATPELGHVDQVRELAPVDLEQVRAAMAKVVEQAEKDDPKALWARIRRLEKELVDRAPKVEHVEVPVLTPDQVDDLEHAAGDCYEAAKQAKEAADTITAAIAKVKWTPATPRGLRQVPISAIAEPPRRAPAPVQTSGRVEVTGLKKGAREMLRLLVAAQTQLGRDLTRRELATLAGMRQSGSFSDYLSRIRSMGLVDYGANGDPHATAAGVAAVKVPGALPTVDHVLARWQPHLKAGARRMLEVLVDAHPDALAREDLAAAVNMEQSGSFSDYLSRLRSSGLVDGLKASDAVFLGGR